MSVKSLAEIADVTMGQAPEGSTYNTSGNGYPLIAGAGDFGENNPIPVKYTTAPTRLSKQGDIILCIRATIGDLNWSDKVYCLGRGVAGIRPKLNVIDPLYLWHAIGSQKQQLENEGHGSTFKQVSRDAVKDLKISVPSLPEQRRIATILDKADAIRRKRRQAIDLMNDFLRSVFLEMFGDSISNEKEFRHKPLGQLLTKIDSGKSPICLSEVAKKDQWGVLKLSAVTSNTFKSDENKALPSSEKPNPDYEVKDGDLLFTRKNTYELVGACALVLKTRAKLLLPDLIFRLVIDPSKSMLPSFLWGVLTSPPYRQKIKKLAGGTAGSMPNISKARLETLLVPVPEIELQKKFDRIVHKIFRTIETLESSEVVTDSLVLALSSECFGN